MPSIKEICSVLDAIAPPSLAEDWDNTGLLLGDDSLEVTRAMTCLTLTPDSVAEAIAEKAGLVVAHHPLPFRAIKCLTTASTEGQMLWDLARAGISIYSPHTAFDSSARGINVALATGLGIVDPLPLLPEETNPQVGAGRVGNVAGELTLDAFAVLTKEFLGTPTVRIVGASDAPVHRVAVACGSGGSFIPAAVDAGADVLVTGEATFHNCLAAEAHQLALVLPGHYASERFAVEHLADWLGQECDGLTVWASQQESDPLRTL